MYEPWPRDERQDGGELDSVPPGYDAASAADGGEPVRLSRLQEFRFVRDGRSTVADRVDYAVHAAYALPDGGWRTANIIFAYVVAAPGLYVVAALDWALLTRLPRTLTAVPVALALVWLCNQMPLVGWLVPDQWDASTWFAAAPADPGVVELPMDVPPVGEG